MGGDDMPNRPVSRSSLFQLLNFGRPRTLQLPVSAYGKLPFYKDFLRHGLAGQEAQAFKKWLDHGISKLWASQEAYRDHEIGAFALLLSFPGTGQQVLAYLWGSHDHGALRRFPFTVFVSLPTDRSMAPLEYLSALAQVVSHGRTLREELKGIEGVDQFYPLIRTRTVEVILEGDRKVREQYLGSEEPKVGHLGTLIFRDEAKERWPALLATVKYPPKGDKKPFAVRLPTTLSLPQECMAAFWCLLSAKRRKAPLQVLWSTDGPTAGISVLHRPLEPLDILALHPEMPEYPDIADLRKPLSPSAPVKPLAEDQLTKPFGAILEKSFRLT